MWEMQFTRDSLTRTQAFYVVQVSCAQSNAPNIEFLTQQVLQA